MAKDWVEPNPDHPRDPDNGEFTDKPGTGDWASKISDEIGKNFNPEDAAMLRDRLARAGDALAGLGDALRGAGQHVRRDISEQQAQQSDPLFHQEMTDMLEKQQADEARRNATLDAFNPPAALRRELGKLFDQLDIPKESGVSAIEEHVPYAQGEDLKVPIGDYQLDSGLLNYTRLIDHNEAQRLRDALERIDPDRSRFPGTWDSLDEIDDIWDNGQYE